MHSVIIGNSNVHTCYIILTNDVSMESHKFVQHCRVIKMIRSTVLPFSQICLVSNFSAGSDGLNADLSALERQQEEWAMSSRAQDIAELEAQVRELERQVAALVPRRERAESKVSISTKRLEHLRCYGKLQAM